MCNGFNPFLVGRVFYFQLLWEKFSRWDWPQQFDSLICKVPRSSLSGQGLARLLAIRDTARSVISAMQISTNIFGPETDTKTFSLRAKSHQNTKCELIFRVFFPLSFPLPKMSIFISLRILRSHKPFINLCSSNFLCNPMAVHLTSQKPNFAFLSFLFFVYY